MNDKIDKIQEIINKSGNTFHSEVVSFFRKDGWKVIVSPYYNDNLSNKSREIDLIAEKDYLLKSTFTQRSGNIKIRLFIECKYIQNDNPIVFWFDKCDQKKAIKRAMELTNLPKPTENIAIEKNHLLNFSEVAKLFASKPNSLPENDIIYKAINQCLNATLYFEHKGNELFEKENETPTIHTVNYPIVICNNFSNIFKTDFKSSPYQLISNNFALEINYAYIDKNKNNREKYFLVDVIDFTKINNYLEHIEENDILPLKEYRAQDMLFQTIRSNGLL